MKILETVWPRKGVAVQVHETEGDLSLGVLFMVLGLPGQAGQKDRYNRRTCATQWKNTCSLGGRRGGGSVLNGLA